MTTRLLRAIAVALVLGGATVRWAGTVLDGNGRFVFGAWAILWGGVASSIGLGLGAGGHVGRAVLALVMAIVALGTWMWIVLWQVPPFTLEGAWMYPLAAWTTAAAVVAARSLGGRGSSGD